MTPRITAGPSQVHQLSYLRAKAVDTAALLDWLADELATLRRDAPHHAATVNQLENELGRARAHLSDMRMLIEIAEPALVPYAMRHLHSLELTTNRVAVTYLPALQRERDAERFVRGLLLAAARAAGMTWLRDVSVRLDRPHTSYVAFPDVPIVSAPTRHVASLFDMPGLYHELGHAVFKREPDVGAVLRHEVDAHFAAQRGLGGPLAPGKRGEREKSIDQARSYWGDLRLAEIFCDVFATYACGPAHYTSFVDLGLRQSENPYAVLTGDPHPPLCARERVCYEALALAQRHEALVVVMREAWAAHEQTRPSNQHYALTCGDPLLSALVSASVSAIKRLLPDGTRFVTPLPPTDQLEDLPRGAGLELILNHATALLFLAPDRYRAWEPAALAACREISLRTAASLSAPAAPRASPAPPQARGAEPPASPT